MLRITPSTSGKGAKEYFTQSLTRDDTGYYHEGQELAGQWGGKTATMLGLSGSVSREQFFALTENKNPETGERLTARNKQGRRVGYDFTFSAPKSVTALYELTGDERILEAFKQSFRETMNEMEPEMMARVRKKGQDNDRVTGNMVYAEFVHFTSRPVTEKKDSPSLPDPHLHAHVYAFNVTHDAEEDRFKAGQFGGLKKNAIYWEGSFDNRLAKKLNNLGIATEKRGLSFEVAGVPQSVIDKFSRRRNEIERKAAEKGITDAQGKHAIGYYGREHKKTGLTKQELRKEWNSRLDDDERSALSDAIHGRAKGDREITPDEAKAYALEHCFERASAVNEKRVKAVALKYAPGSVLPEQVSDIAQHPEAIPVKHQGEAMMTTKTVLRNEVAFLQFAIDGQRRQKPLLASTAPGETVETHLEGAFASLGGLSEEQKKAALHILNSRDTVTGVRGQAGTGKTTMMRATRDVIESVPGQRVYAFAPSSQASRGVLASEGFKDAETLEMLLKNEKLQEKVKGQVLWIDEAGLVSAKDMRRLMDVAKRNGNRVVLSGDYGQHSSVEAGDAFRLLEKEGGVKLAKLTEIRRQKTPGYKKAVEAIAQGTGNAAQKGFDALEKIGCVIEAEGDERRSMLVNDYLRAVDDGRTALIVDPTHAGGRKITEELRGRLKERGVLGEEREFTTRIKTGWTDAEAGDYRNYQPGMVVEFNKAIPGKRQRVNGQRVTLGGFAKGEVTVVTACEDGKVKLLRQNGQEAILPDDSKTFSVFRTRELTVAKGDRIRITKNGEAKGEGQTKGAKVNNGDIFTVEGFTQEGGIRIGKGKVLPKGWGHMSLGYVDTSYASQGKTTDRVFISVGDESLAAANQQQWYVSASRGREQAKLYVDSKEDVRDAITKTGERLSAVELTHTKIRHSAWRQRFYQSLERNRVGRFLKQRAEAITQRWRKEGISHA